MWQVTKYFVKVIGVDQNLVTPVFGLTSISAPLLGVFMGGFIIDKLGGYQGAAGLALTLKCCSIFGALASGCGAPPPPQPCIATCRMLALCAAAVSGARTRRAAPAQRMRHGLE